MDSIVNDLVLQLFIVHEFCSIRTLLPLFYRLCPVTVVRDTSGNLGEASNR